jgi:hypothetical protein
MSRFNQLKKSLVNHPTDEEENESKKDAVVLTDDDRFHYEKRYVEGTSVKLPETTYELAHSRWLDSLRLEALRDMYSEYIGAVKDNDEEDYTNRKMVEAGYWDSSLKD